jgi:hypothetical protein
MIEEVQDEFEVELDEIDAQPEPSQQYAENEESEEYAEDTEEEEEQYEDNSLISWYAENYGEVPEEITNPTELIASIIESYEEKIARLTEEATLTTSSKAEADYRAFLAIDKENALLMYLEEVGYSPTAARQKVDRYIVNNELDLEYDMVRNLVERNYVADVEAERSALREEKARAERLEYEQEQRDYALYQQHLDEMRFDLFELDQNDKRFLKDVFYKRQTSGTTMFEDIASDPVRATEMVMALVKVRELAANQKNVDKRATANVVSKLSKEPIVNSRKNTKSASPMDYWREEEGDAPSL